MKHWFHDFGGNGPDYFLYLKADERRIEQARVRVRRLELDELERYTELRDGSDIDHYVNRHHLAAFTANFEGRGASNIWIYNWIAIEADYVRFERGYGGYGDGAATRDEQRIIAAVLDEIAIDRWHISAGGQGYDCVGVANGDDSDSLIAYLE